MTYSSKYLTPALIALSVFAFSPAHAGADKNGAGEPDAPVASGHQGGGGDDKNGNGEVDKNGNGDNNGGGETTDRPPPRGEEHVDKNGELPERPTPPSAPPPPGGGEHVKNGEPPAPPRPSSPPPSGGGNSSDIGTANITCVINGQVFRVRSVRECYVQPQYGSYQPRVPSYQPRAKKRRAVVAGGYAYGGGYVYAPQPVIRYYQPASPAAVMQAQKRARRAQGYGYSGGYAVQGGYGYAPQAYGYAPQGYGYGGGYAVQGGNGYGQGYGVSRKKHRRVRSNVPVYMPNYSYDPGYVIHYGPTISKDGGY
jgi:hypothetical protein